MSVHRSPFPDIVLPTSPLTEYVLARGKAIGDRPALIDGPSGRTITYRQLDEQVHHLAGGLAARGIGPGSVIGLMAPNVPEYAVVFHATAVAGATVTTINPAYTAEEVRFQLLDAGATLLVTTAAFHDVARQASEGTSVTELVVIDADLGGDATATDLGGATPLSELFADPIAQVAVDPSTQVVVLPYSSGTTGLPKGVMLTHANLAANLAQCRLVLPYEDGEIALAVLPFFHIYGMQVLMNGLLAAGCTIVTMPRFDLVQALELIQTHRATRFYAVPPIVLALAKHPIIDNYDLSSLHGIMCGAAPLGGELAAEAAARIGCEISQGYGMTELSPVTHVSPPGNIRPGTVGVAVPNTECRLVDPDTGADAADGASGELWIRGPQVMAGYLNNPEATAATIDHDRWLHTGDVAEIDLDGQMRIVDRVKELIKVKGFQVAPAELEALILTHPAVADVAVIGIPDDASGELPKAFVVLKDGQEASGSDISDFVAGHVATYKRLAVVDFVEAIPKSASGKILRRLLRDAS